MNGISMARGSLLRSVFAAFAALIVLGVSAPASHAATQAGYPSALIEFGASARTVPYLSWGGSNTYAGYVLRERGSSARQTASVSCWFDGSWVAPPAAAYGTNRWFRVLVWEDWDGYNVPRWLFVHASYVYNQPGGVRPCYQTSTGVW